MRNRSGYIAAALIMFSILCYGQDDDYKTSPSAGTAEPQKKSKFDRDKLFFGGGLGLQFGSYTLVDVSPLAGYKFTDDLSAGVGISWQYISVRRPAFSTHTYGGGPFVRYVIFENLFAHVEYQILNSEYFLVDNNYQIISTFRENVHYFWIGGGYRQPLGGRAYLMLMALYNLNDSELSIYPSNPILRMGVNIGL